MQYGTTIQLKMIFGKRVRELRKRKGYSQEELADKAGLHRTYIGSIERGEQNVSIDNIDKIAGALKTPISLLFS
jgi:transcriptional regulator with XRE-family HTH domain